MTYDQEIGEEAAAIFQALFMGETVRVSKKLLVAPNCLQNRLLDMIEEEIRHAKRGEEAYIGVKMNSLTDKKLMDKLIEASQAGVEIELIVRGICCLIPGVEGYTEKHPGHQYCRTFSRTFQNLHIWKRRKTGKFI